MNSELKQGYSPCFIWKTQHAVPQIIILDCVHYSSHVCTEGRGMREESWSCHRSRTKAERRAQYRRWRALYTSGNKRDTNGQTAFCVLKLDVTENGRSGWEQSDRWTLSLSVFGHLSVNRTKDGAWWWGAQVKSLSSSSSWSFWDPLQKLKLILNFHIL